MTNEDIDGLMKNLEASLRQSAEFEWFMKNVAGVQVELLAEIAKRLPEPTMIKLHRFENDNAD